MKETLLLLAVAIASIAFIVGVLTFAHNHDMIFSYHSDHTNVVVSADQRHPANNG